MISSEDIIAKVEGYVDDLWKNEHAAKYNHVLGELSSYPNRYRIPVTGVRHKPCYILGRNANFVQIGLRSFGLMSICTSCGDLLTRTTTGPNKCNELWYDEEIGRQIQETFGVSIEDMANDNFDTSTFTQRIREKITREIERISERTREMSARLEEIHERMEAQATERSRLIGTLSDLQASNADLTQRGENNSSYKT